MFVDRIFKSTNKNRFLYIIFAGSGMGKTTFAVQLFISYINKYKESNIPFDIYIENMADANILNNINNLSHRLAEKAHDSILILDALDENNQAAEDFESFRNQLESAIEPYKFVVITCRSQFFPDDQSVPENSNILCNTADKSLLRYNKIFICPFSPDDIDLYIRRKYKRKKRKKAKSIIERCSHLMARPVLLAHIDDLLDEKETFQDEATIYKILIDKWIQREVNTVANPSLREQQKQELYRFSSLFATAIYHNWKDTGVYKMSKAQLNEFCNRNHFETDFTKFRQRSLINHDSSGAYKFSHKSFMEFFLAQELFNNPSFSLNFEGMDMAQLFYEGLCKEEFRILQEKGVIRISSLLSSRFSSGNNIKLYVDKKTDYIYKRLLFVIDVDQLSEISIAWNAYDDRLQEFLNMSKVNTVSILDYQKGDSSLKGILDSPFVNYMSIYGDTIPNAFIKEASKRPMVVFSNGIKMVNNLRDYSGASLNIQLMQKKNLQIMIDDANKRLNDTDRLIAEIARMKQLLNNVERSDGNGL